MRSLFAATTLACALLFFGSPAKASYILDMPVTASPTKHQRAQATHNHQQKPSRVAERPQAAPVWTASIFSAVITRAELGKPRAGFDQRRRAPAGMVRLVHASVVPRGRPQTLILRSTGRAFGDMRLPGRTSAPSPFGRSATGMDTSP